MKLSLRVFVFFFIKYIVFYLFLMVKNSNYGILNVTKLKTSEDVLYYLYLFIPLPLICAIIFSIPLSYSLKAKNAIVFLSVFLGCLILEYFIYTYLTSQKYIDKDGIYNAIISIAIFVAIFYKEVKDLLKLDAL